MSSLQKQSPLRREENSEMFVINFEKNLAAMKNSTEVELLMKKLQYLGLNYDPFMPEVTDECQQVMDSLGLTEHLKNPYQATNILLRLLDKTEEQLNSLKQ